MMIPLCLLLTLSPQEPTRSLAIVPRFRQEHAGPHECPPFGSLLPSPGEEGNRLDLLHEATEEVGGDELTMRFLQIAHAADFERGAVAVAEAGSRSVVSGDQVLLQAIGGELQALRGTILRPIEVEALLSTCKDPAAQVVLAPAGSPAVGNGTGDVLWRGRSSTCGRGLMTFDALRWTRYVRHVEIEVAQKETISRPVLSSFAEGFAATVAAYPLSDSEDVVLFVQFAVGHRLRMDSLVTGVAGQPNLDLPVIESTFGAAAARVPADGTMQLVLGGAASGGGSLTLQFRPRYPTPRSAARIGEVAVYPVAALCTPALHGRTRLPDGRPLDLDQVGQATFEEAGEPVMEIDRILDIVQQAIGSADPTASVEVADGHLLVRGNAATHAAVTTTLTRLQDQLLRTCALRCCCELRETAGGAPFASDLPQGSAQTLHCLALPSLPGHTAVVFRGIENNAVREVLPEIAQEASSTWSFVEVRQSGLWLQFTPSDDPAVEPMQLQAQLAWHSPPELRSLGGLGAMHLGEQAAVRARLQQPLPAGRVLEIGQGATIAIDGKDWRPTLRVERLALDQAQR